MTLGGSLQFTFGLISSGGKYLTAETFGFKIAASGASLKKKQTWNLEQKADGSNDVYFKSCLGRYLGADKNGAVSCDAEEAGEENAFQVESTSDGKWAIKSSKYGRYFGGSGANLSCFEQAISPTYLWSVHLAMHPQVNIFNARQQRFAHVSADGDELLMREPTPWGVDFLVTLVYRDHGYAIVTSNNRYLSASGELVASCSQDTLYTIEFFSGKIAFKSKSNSKYLAPVGPKGRIETRKSSAGKDEFFTLVDSHPQVSLFSKTKQRFVSGKQGLQLSANQDEVEVKETFQLEIDAATDKVYLRNDQDKYWRANGASIQADATSKSDADAAFTLEWLGRHVRLMTSSGRYVNVKASGHLIASDEAEDFTLALTNRPLVVLRGEYGFVGSKGSKVDGNRASYDIFEMEQRDGAYVIKAPNGKYLSVDGEMKVSADHEGGTPFLIQLCKNSRLALKPDEPAGAGYVTSDHVGYMTASGKSVDKSTLWEY